MAFFLNLDEITSFQINISYLQLKFHPINNRDNKTQICLIIKLNIFELYKRIYFENI